MMEFNLADPVKKDSLPGGFKQSRKINAHGESDQSMSFAALLISPPSDKREDSFLNKSEKTFVIEGHNREFSKDGKTTLALPRTGIESGSKKSGLTRAVMGKEGDFKGTKDAIIESSGGKKGVDNFLKHSGLKGEETKLNHEKSESRELRGQKMMTPQKETFSSMRLADKISSMEEDHQIANHAATRDGKRLPMGDATMALLKTGMESRSKKSGSARADMEKKGDLKGTKGAIIESSGGKKGSDNFLKCSGLKGADTMFNHEKSEGKEFTDQKMTASDKENFLSMRLVDKTPLAGGYQHTAIHENTVAMAGNQSADTSVMEPRALIDQIARAVNSPGRVKIALTPPHLGTLNMDVLVRNNKVQIILQAENNDVRQILQSNMETLKNALRSQGLVADNIIVFVQEKLDSDGYLGFGRDESVFKDGNNRKDKEYPRAGSDSLDHNPILLNKGKPHNLIDGRISLFA